MFVDRRGTERRGELVRFAPYIVESAARRSEHLMEQHCRWTEVAQAAQTIVDYAAYQAGLCRADLRVVEGLGKDGVA